MDNFLGEIRPFAGNYTPNGWKLCDGSLLNVADYSALFALLSTNFGGDGVRTFALPDLRGRLPIGSGQSPGLSRRLFASSGGSEMVTLTNTEMPVHSHAFMVTTNAATDSSPNGKLFANPNPNSFYGTTPNPKAPLQVLNTDSVTNTGENNPHENRMPAMAINYIIAVTGIFPTQE